MVPLVSVNSIWKSEYSICLPSLEVAVTESFEDLMEVGFGVEMESLRGKTFVNIFCKDYWIFIYPIDKVIFS